MGFSQGRGPKDGVNFLPIRARLEVSRERFVAGSAAMCGARRRVLVAALISVLAELRRLARSSGKRAEGDRLLASLDSLTTAMRELVLGLSALLQLKKRFSAIRARLRIRPLSAALRTEMAPEVIIEGRVWIPGEGRVRLGHGVRLRARRAPIELRAHAGAEISLGDAVTVEAGASIEATRRIDIGARASIGSFAKILDNHYHRTVGDRQERPPGVPNSIGEDARVGPRAILLPGARLAAGTVVGAGEVLSRRQEGDPSRSRRRGVTRVA